MRIGIDGRELLRNQITGIGRFLSNFLKYAPEIKPDWEFILFMNQHNAGADVPICPNLKQMVIPENWTFWWDQVKLPKYLRKEKIDIFFSPYYKAPIFSPCPTVITIHDIAPFVKCRATFSRLHYGHKRFALRIWSRFFARRATKNITVSNYSKKDIMNIFEISEEKIAVVYEGVREEFKPKEKEDVEKVKERYGIRGKYIFYIGNFEPHKNVEGILRAYSKINYELQKNCKLVIGGKKDGNFKKIKRLCLNLKIKKNAIFPGFIEDADLPALYSGAEIFLFPSFYEGFGLPPLEAMACGTPVISSNRTSLPEILGDAPILINPQNPDEIAKAIENILTNENLQKELKKKGIKRAAQFSLEDMSKKILDIFESSYSVH